MSAQPRVLVGYDQSEPSEHAVRWAAQEASRRGWPLVVVHSVDAVPPVFMDADPAVAASAGADEVEGGSRLAGLAAELELEHRGLEVRAEQRSGGGAGTLVEESALPGLVVIGTRGRGPLKAALLGGTADAVVTHLRGPVVVVPGAFQADGPVVAAVDGGPASEAVAERAVEQARLMGAPVLVVQAWDVEYPQPGMDGLAVMPDLTEGIHDALAEVHDGIVERVRAAAGDVPVAGRLVRGLPAAVLEEISPTARLVVMGTRGRGGFTGMLLGSTSRKTVSRSHCPVLVVPTREASEASHPAPRHG